MSCNSFTSGSWGSAQPSHTLRTRRCATTDFNAVAIKYPSTPISTSRYRRFRCCPITLTLYTTAGLSGFFSNRVSSSMQNMSVGSTIPNRYPLLSSRSTSTRKHRARTSGNLCARSLSKRNCLSSIKGISSCSETGVSTSFSPTKSSPISVCPNLRPVRF